MSRRLQSGGEAAARGNALAGLAFLLLLPGCGNKTEPPPVVSVHISTRPEGAVIRLKDRVFGRAPMNLRFRPGVPFELSFVKSGYVTSTRRFTFAKRKNQSVTVQLARRPVKKKSFFQRLFGG